MRSAHKDMECPRCHETRCREPISAPASRDPKIYTVRKYRCKKCGWEYETEERVVGSTVRVTVAGEPFNTRKFISDLDQYVPKRLTISDADLVMEQLISNLGREAERPGQGRRPVNGVRIEADGSVSVLDRPALARLTMQAFINAGASARAANPELAARLDAALIQYALATIGGTLGKNMGWHTAADFLRWFRRVDHHSRAYEPPVQGLQEPQKAYWGVPSMFPPTPIRTVVTNKFVADKEPRQRIQQPFEPKKLRSTVALAFRGRPEGENLAKNVEMYVRWSLVGQSVVRTSQLSTLISEVLRALDDIAYLRWVMAGKELDATTVYDEAVALIEHPSPRLQFRVNSPTLVRAALTPTPIQTLEADQQVENQPA